MSNNDKQQDVTSSKKEEEEAKARREKQLAEEKRQREKVRQKERAEAKKEFKEKSEEMKQELKRKKLIMPIGVRLGNIVTGMVYVALATYIVLSPDIAIDIAILIFGGIIAISGIIRVLNAFYDKDIGGTKRIIRFIFGILIILIGATVLVIQSFGEDLLLIVIGIGLALQGLNRVFLGIGHNLLPLWTRVLLLLVGIFAIVIAVMVFLQFDYTTGDLVTLLAYAFFFGGWSRMSLGLAGIRAVKPDNKK